MSENSISNHYFKIKTAIDQQDKDTITNIPNQIRNLDFVEILEIYRNNNGSIHTCNEAQSLATRILSEELKLSFLMEVYEIQNRIASNSMIDANLNILFSSLSKEEFSMIIELINEERLFLSENWKLFQKEIEPSAKAQ